MDKYTVLKRPVTAGKVKVGDTIELSPVQAKYLLFSGAIEKVGGLIAPGKLTVDVPTVPKKHRKKLEEELEGEEDGNISSTEHE